MLVWGHECAGRIIGIAQKEQSRLPLLKGLPDPLRRHVKTLCTPGGVLVQAGPHQGSRSRVLAERGTHQQYRVASPHKSQGHEPDELGTAIPNEELIDAHVQRRGQHTTQGEHFTIRIALVGHLGLAPRARMVKGRTDSHSH